MSQDEVCQQASAMQISQGQILNITLLASEWKSSAGGLSTLNRELAIHLSQIQNVRVSLLVPEGACNDEDKTEARSFGINILDAKKCVGLDPLVWLSNPPQDHKIDVIVGHGVKLGCQVQVIKRQAQFQNCKWVHVVHTASEDLSKYKDYSNPNSKGEKKLWDEVDLCKEADLVVPVGPKLRKAYHRYLLSNKNSGDFFELIPGLFEREFGHLAAKQNPKDETDDFIVLLCGRGDKEDFEVKGYDIAVKAFADQRLKGKRFSLLFVGSPKGEQDNVRERLLNCGIDKKQLTVREFVKSREKMKDLFCEADMAIMPSKSEGFGLVALEALSAGLPILVGSNSGFARAIEDIPLGFFSIVNSEDSAKWAERVEGVRDRHRVALKESKILKEHYGKEYCWKTQCEELVDKLWKMVYGTSGAQAVAAVDLVEHCPSAFSESVCRPNPTTMQQHLEISAVTSGRKNEGTSRTSGDGLTMRELAGTSGAQAIAADELSQERPTSSVSESVCQPDPKTMQQETEKGAVTSARNDAMTALPNPPLEAALGRATSHISPSELRSSGSGAVQNVGVSSLKGTSSGLPETQRKSVDLVILGCQISEESIDIAKEVFLSLCLLLHIESHISKNCTPVEAKVCLEKIVARFCVLLIDAETVNDAYTTLSVRKREYENLLQTAALRVAEKVIVMIFKPCSFPTAKDEILVTQSIESTIVVSGKGHVLYVEDDSTKVKSQRIRDIREKIINLFPSLKSQSYSNDSISRRDFKQSFNVTERTVPNTLKGCRPAHPPQYLTEYGAHRTVAYQSQQSSSMQPRGLQWANQDVSSIEGFVMLRSRLKFGRLTNDVEIHYPGFIVPHYIAKGMYETYQNTSEVVVEVRSDGRGGYAWCPYTKRSLVQLGQSETVVLKTRLCYGVISQEKGKLEFIYPGWRAPSYLIEDLMKKYQSCSDRELYIISNEKGELRLLLFKEGHFENIKKFFVTENK